MNFDDIPIFSGGTVLSKKSELERLRDEIARVTLEIFRLCKRRIELARKIATVKMKEGLPIEDLKVERNLKRRVLEFCRGSGIEDEFCIGLLDLLIRESKRVQEEEIGSGSPEMREEGFS